MLAAPGPVLRDLKKLAAEVVKEESEKTPMARKVHASFTKFQALVRSVGSRRGGRLPSARRRVRAAMMTERRRFIATASGVVAAAAAAAVVDAPNVIAQPKIQWRMSTAWTPALDCSRARPSDWRKIVEETSGGRFRIEVFPGGQIMQPLECFDAASQGHDRGVHGVLVLLDRRRSPRVEWFLTIPFGMNPEGMTAWYYQGDGLKLWEEVYAAFNLVPRPGPTYAPQMAGWFRKKINTIGDFKGLKMRIGVRSAARSYAGRAARPSSRRPPRSSPRSSGA